MAAWRSLTLTLRFSVLLGPSLRLEVLVISGALARGGKDCRGSKCSLFRQPRIKVQTAKLRKGWTAPINADPTTNEVTDMNDVLAPVLFFDGYSRLGVLENLVAQRC